MAKIIEEDEIPDRGYTTRYPWAEWLKMLGDAPVGTVLELERNDFPEESFVYRHWDKPVKRSALTQQAKTQKIEVTVRMPNIYLKLKNQP